MINSGQSLKTKDQRPNQGIKVKGQNPMVAPQPLASGLWSLDFPLVVGHWDLVSGHFRNLAP